MIYESFKEKIISNEYHYSLNYNPNEKIAYYYISLSNCFESYLNLKSSYVLVAVFYHFDFQNEDEYNRFDKVYFPVFETNSVIILEPNSLIGDGTEDFYLLNDKYREGVKKNRYKLNYKDIGTKTLS